MKTFDIQNVIYILINGVKEIRECNSGKQYTWCLTLRFTFFIYDRINKTELKFVKIPRIRNLNDFSIITLIKALLNFSLQLWFLIKRLQLHYFPHMCQTISATDSQNSTEPAKTAIHALRFRFFLRWTGTISCPKLGSTDSLVVIVINNHSRWEGLTRSIRI